MLLTYACLLVRLILWCVVTAVATAEMRGNSWFPNGYKKSVNDILDSDATRNMCGNGRRPCAASVSCLSHLKKTFSSLYPTTSSVHPESVLILHPREMQMSSVPPAASVRLAAKHALAGLQRVGGVFLAGVRPDSPSRSDAF